MGGFRTAFINELEKLYKKRKVLAAIIISITIIVICQLAATNIRNSLGVQGFGSIIFPLFILSVLVNYILPLFTALVTINSFSSEFTHNTMKIVLTRPVTRFKFLMAKLCSIMVFAAFNLFLVMVLSIIADIIFDSSSFSLSGLFTVLISYFVTLLPILVLTVIIISIANIVQNGVGVLFISIIIYIAFKVLGILYPQISGLLFTSMFDWYRLWFISTVPFTKLLRMFMIMCSYVIIFFTGSYYLFDKKDF